MQKNLRTIDVKENPFLVARLVLEHRVWFSFSAESNCSHGDAEVQPDITQDGSMSASVCPVNMIALLCQYGP